MDGVTPLGDPMVGVSLREMPSNLRAERALLGALLANNKALSRVEEFLAEHHFHDPLHGRIYGAIAQRVSQGGVADGISLMQAFANDPMMAEAGGPGYLATLLASMVGIVNAAEYAKAVRDTWMRRELIQACGAAIDGAFGGATTAAPAAVMEALDARLLRIVEGAGDEAPLVSAGLSVQQALLGAQEAAQRESPLAGLTTGFAALDRMTAGLQRQQLILLGARTSMGKTALALGMAYRAAATGARVLFWSGEMAAAQLGARAAAAFAMLDTTSVFTGRRWAVPGDAVGRREPLDREDWAALTRAEATAHTLPLLFDTRPGLTVPALRARARRMKRAGGLDLLVIDYVGLLRAAGGNERAKLYERITEISGELMALKAELDIPILAMAQLNRANEARDDKMPQLSDLRDSGALEQDANVVLLLHRPHYYLKRADPQRRGNEGDEAFANRYAQHQRQLETEDGHAQISVAKNRNGPTGLTRLRFHDSTSWFRDESEAWDSPAWSANLGI